MGVPRLDWVNIAHEIVAYHKEHGAWPTRTITLGRHLRELRQARNHPEKKLHGRMAEAFPVLDAYDPTWADNQKATTDWVKVAHNAVTYHRQHGAWPGQRTTLGAQLSLLRTARKYPGKYLRGNMAEAFPVLAVYDAIWAENQLLLDWLKVAHDLFAYRQKRGEWPVQKTALGPHLSQLRAFERAGALTAAQREAVEWLDAQQVPWRISPRQMNHQHFEALSEWAKKLMVENPNLSDVELASLAGDYLGIDFVTMRDGMLVVKGRPLVGRRRTISPEGETVVEIVEPSTDETTTEADWAVILDPEQDTTETAAPNAAEGSTTPGAPVLPLVDDTDDVWGDTDTPADPFAAARVYDNSPAMTPTAPEYLTAVGVARMWTIVERLEAAGDQDALTRYVTAQHPENIDGEWSALIGAQFTDEFEAANTMTAPPRWTFQPYGATEVTAPNLMQRRTAVRAIQDRSLGNWSGTGSGKTVSAILTAEADHAGYDGVVVVACPTGRVAQQWATEVAGAIDGARVVLAGDLWTWEPVWEEGDGPRWLIAGYSKFMDSQTGNLTRFLETVPIDMVVVDELHQIKHRGGRNTAVGFVAPSEESARRRGVKALVEATRGGTRTDGLTPLVLAMTATPTVNDLTETRSLIEVVAPDEAALMGVDVRKPSDVMNAHKAVARFGVRSMSAVTDLVRRNVVEVPVFAPAAAAAVEAADGEAEYARAVLPFKLDAIRKECLAAQAAGRVAVVFTLYVKDMIEPIQRHLTAAGLRVAVYSGDDKSGLSMVQEGRADVLIGTQSVSTGVDGLQHRADRMIFATLPWTFAEWEQIVGRVHRTGQDVDEVRIVTPLVEYTTPADVDHNGDRFLSWDRYVKALIASKRDLAEAVLTGNGIGSTLNGGNARDLFKAYRKTLAGRHLETVDNAA